MTRAQATGANPAPGAGTIFALRAIGLVLLARWLYSMSEMGYGPAFSAITSSPWASINVVFLFLLIGLPGSKARAERPLHPLPQWLRQALRLFALLGLLFALWSIGAFVWAAGWRPAVQAIAATNGWLAVAPALYAAVLWICRPRALWRTNVAARRFAIGRYAIALDAMTRTVVVWGESRKLGQYDARELSVKWLAAAVPTLEPAPSEPHTRTEGVGIATGVATAGVASPGMGGPAIARPNVVASGPALAPGHRAGRSRVELLWDSPAAVGHNRQTVFRVKLTSEGDRAAARALDMTLRQV